MIACHGRPQDPLRLCITIAKVRLALRSMLGFFDNAIIKDAG